VERAAHVLPAYEPSPRLWARLEAVAVAEGLWGRSVGERWLGLRWELFPLRPALASVLTLTLFLGVGLVGYPTLELPLGKSLPATPFEVAQSELVQEASYATRYHAHLQQVEEQVLAEAAPEDTQLRALMTGPLKTVDRAIEQTELRLADYPDDMLARAELHRLYRQKATVLQAMSNPVWLEVSH